MNPSDFFSGSFTSEDLAYALSRMSESTSGSKAERAYRLAVLKKPLKEILENFSSEALAYACEQHALQPGRKTDSIARLLEYVDGAGREDGADATPQRVAATREGVVSALRQMHVPLRRAVEESAAESEIATTLRRSFEDVVNQYNVGGYFGSRIDLDLGNGKVGVEVKLAKPLLDSSGAYGLVGQAVHYQRRRYGDSLIVAVVGRREELDHPALRETLSFLESLGVSCVPIPAI